MCERRGKEELSLFGIFIHKEWFYLVGFLPFTLHFLAPELQLYLNAK